MNKYIYINIHLITTPNSSCKQWNKTKTPQKIYGNPQYMEGGFVS